MPDRSEKLRILALNPYDGGSHRDFLQGWIADSEHDWTVLGLRAHKWKWRMHHATYSFAEMIRESYRDDTWDLIYTTDMMNVAELRGLLPARLRNVPILLYFHENQLTYPQHPNARVDLHFAFTNLMSAAAADAVWFNSAYHRDEFLPGMRKAMAKMPDHQPLALIDEIHETAQVHSPGVAEITPRECGSREPGPLRILWSARWEFDKNPACFFDALDILVDRKVPFRLSVLGRSTGSWMKLFDEAEEKFAAYVDDWGFLDSRADFEDALRRADVVVSTAQHEFFGIAVAEAAAAGALPVVPGSLAYPEVLVDLVAADDAEDWFHDNAPASVADRLEQLSVRLAETGGIWPSSISSARQAVSVHFWPRAAARMDRAATEIVSSFASRS